MISTRQISPDLSVCSKSIRVNNEIGTTDVCNADSYLEISLSFIKIQTNCSTMFYIIPLEESPSL